MYIQTPRLVIRRFQPDDGGGLYEYLGDARVVRYEPYDVYSREECEREAARRADDPAFFAVCLRGCGKMIGNVYLHHASPTELSTWELGFVFGVPYQKHGYAFESCRALIDYAMELWNARRIVASCNPDNINSWRLLERLGFRREGHLRRNVYFHRDENGDPIWQDTYQYAILADEWLGHDGVACLANENHKLGRAGRAEREA